MLCWIFSVLSHYHFVRLLESPDFQILLFLFLWQTNKQTLTLNGIVLCDQPQKAIDSSKDWQRAAGPLTNEGELFYVCIYVIGQAREAKRGRVPASAGANETGQNEPFSQNPLWLKSLFSHQSPWDCSVSLYERHPDGIEGSKPRRQRGGKPGARQQQRNVRD